MFPRSTWASRPETQTAATRIDFTNAPPIAIFRRYYHLRSWKAMIAAIVLLECIFEPFAASQTAAAALQEGRNAFREKDWTTAERAFLRAVKAAPKSATAHKWLGMTYAAQEKYLLAEPAFRRACEIDSKEPDACYYLGRTLYSLSRFEAALRAYEKDSRPWRGRTLLGMALALDALDRDSDAEKMYRDAIRAGERQAAPEFEKFQRKRSSPGVASPDIRFDAMDLPVTVRNGATGNKRLI